MLYNACMKQIIYWVVADEARAETGWFNSIGIRPAEKPAEVLHNGVFKDAVYFKVIVPPDIEMMITLRHNLSEHLI